MTRHWYAVLNKEVHSFTKKRDRDKFCKEKGASHIYAYQRCKKYFSEGVKEDDTAQKQVSRNTALIHTQSASEKAIRERLKRFKKS